MSLLRDSVWDVAYSHEDGNLVDMFFVPVLQCAKHYRRATGYFSGDVLAMAARGLDALIASRGRMELLVGCTLSAADIDEIKKGYDIREAAGRSLVNRIALEHETEQARRNMGYLAWMIAHGHLEVKLAIPLDENGEMREGLGLYHAKCGIVEDAAGDVLSFKGSINETPAGWLMNCEAFDVSCSWRGDWDGKKVDKAQDEFCRLWTGAAKSARVMEFPEALKEKLLEYLPKDDAFVMPPKQKGKEEPAAEAEREAEATGAPEAKLDPIALQALRQRVWAYIRRAPARDDGTLVAVKTSAVEPWPHQLRAYERMIRSWPFRLLIADEVGLGKTIEAGMLLRHAWISGLAKRILVMVPKGVIRQWQAELYEKFNLLVPVYDGQALCWPEHHGRQGELQQPVARSAWTQEPFVLVSSHLMRRRERYEELTGAESWDLIVLDEAHHARRSGAGTTQEGGPNRLLRLMEQLRNKTQSLLLLTATPMQVDPVELWDLIALLKVPEGWTRQGFVEYFELVQANPGEKELLRLCRMYQATEATYGAAPENEVERICARYSLSALGRKAVLDALHETKTTIPIRRLSTEQRKAMLGLLRGLSPVFHCMSRHTRSLLRRYYELGLLSSPIATREPEDIAVPLSASERGVYDAVEDYIRRTYNAASAKKKTAVGFVMTIYRRRVASSFHALRRTLEDRLGRLGNGGGTAGDVTSQEDLPDDQQAAEVMGDEEAQELATEALVAEEKQQILELLRSVAKLGTDSKALRLVDHLKKAEADGFGTAIVFTQYTDTMDFLKQYLSDKLDWPIGCFSGRGGERRDASGKWASCSKEQVKRMLRDGQIRVLICTDAAGEGLNLQFCGMLVNYDLPWNPMKVEQRIGRIDRIGQKHPTIRVLNFAYADTVEADVYFALSRRIGLFHGVVGKLQPILSRLPKEFEAAILCEGNDAERCRQEAVANIEELVRKTEQEQFDIDEVSEADLKPPEFPASPVRPEDMDAVLRWPELLPPGVECEELESGTYKMRLPGQQEFARVTPRPAIFDDCFESHQLLWYGGPLFERLAQAAGAVDEVADGPEAKSLGELLERRGQG